MDTFIRKRISIVITLVGLLFIVGACSNDETNDQGDKVNESGDLVLEMGQINWAENIAVTHMWKLILAEEGYEVNFNLLDMGTIMAALANDELDISLEVWLPVQDKNYLEQYADQVNFSEETWYDTAKVGLVVPDYLDEINSVEDLNEHKDMFDSSIVGFDPGAGTMEVTETLIEEYDLDLELLPSSEPAMITELTQAIEKKEAIVSPLWSPHRVFSELDLKFLEDPKNVYGGVEKIHHATRQGFEDDFEDLDRWFKNWKMTDEEVGELMSYVAEAETPDEGASKWISENQALIDSWLEG